MITDEELDALKDLIDRIKDEENNLDLLYELRDRIDELLERVE